MRTPTEALPGIEQAQEYLGLTLKQIAQAVHADESTLHRWRSGVVPSPVFMARLEALDELAREMRNTFRGDQEAREWLRRPLPALGDARPIDVVVAGKAEKLTGMLYALNSGMSL